tara:strand:- start:94 stop:768 length:675 start_codon:yes stop_codon:yes gene_type:complete
MKLSQKMIYVCEQLQFLEEAIVDHSHQKYTQAFDGDKSVDLLSSEGINATIYQHFKYYDGPLLARYMLIIQLYSVFERYSILFSKRLSYEENDISISDLNGGQTFKGIKTYYTKVVDIKYDSWNEIDLLRQVRNLIAHCDGYITYSEQKNKISKAAELDADLKILSDERLVLRNEFIKRSMRAVFKFFDIVEPLVEKPYNLLDFSWGHINKFRQFDLEKKTEQV